MNPKIGEVTKETLMALVKDFLEKNGYDVLQVASGAFGLPAVENEEETAIKLVFQIPKGERGGKGYDVYEDAEAYKFRCHEKEVKRQKKEEKDKRKKKEEE